MFSIPLGTHWTQENPKDPRKGELVLLHKNLLSLIPLDYSIHRQNQQEETMELGDYAVHSST